MPPARVVVIVWSEPDTSSNPAESADRAGEEQRTDDDFVDVDADVGAVSAVSPTTAIS